MKRTMALFLSLLLLLLTACQQEVTAENTPADDTARRVTVNSTDQVAVIPEIAEIVYSIQPRGSDTQT